MDFSQTQRIVILIDLHPLLYLQNPNPYLTTLLTSSQTLLTFPSLSSSLFAFKLFFSSLSPLLSSSTLHRLLAAAKPSSSLSFDRPSETLISLSKTLNSLSKQPPLNSVASPPRASLTATSLLQIIHDYGWEPRIQDPLGTWNNFPVVRSSLILLFSPIRRSLNCLSEFMNVNLNEELLMTVDSFCKKFCGFFDTVNDAFVSRDIHFSWIDVRYELECIDERVEIDESVMQLGFFESGIERLGWGFCSTDSIVLGSAIVPFGLIYPKIGVSSNFLNCGDFREKIHAQLSLEISDVSGKPLECKCCDLELINLKMLPGHGFDDVLRALEFKDSESGGCGQGKTIWRRYGDGITKLHVKAVKRYDECGKVEGRLSDRILVRGFSGESGEDPKISHGGCFADRVLEILSTEMGEFMQRKSIPIWQILLSFFYREGYWALVSISNSNGDSCMGILKPFTVHSALLSIIDDRFYPHNMVHDFGGTNLAHFVRKTDDDICKPNVDMNNSNGFIDSQSGTSSSKKYVAADDGKRKKNKKHSNLHQDLTWSSFREAVFEHSKIDMEEVYFARECNNSKKLKFLKCWMKQIKKSSSCCLTMPDGSVPHQHIAKEIEDKLTGSHQESEQPVSSSVSAGEDSSTGPSRIQEEAAFVSCSENSEAFSSNIQKKIQHGLESKGVELGALAERLVNSSIHWLYQKSEMDTTKESQTPAIKSDETCGGIVSVELIKLLLSEPKDLAAKHKDNDPSFQASAPMSTILASENIVREYELQILFRMEILQSEVAASIEESTKQKFVKQICSLLEKIQYHLEGGFFGDVSLGIYVGRTIKSRYSQTLGDVVHRIYTRMDLLPFGDKDESPNPLLNSEDSNQSWRDKLEGDQLGENNSPQGIRTEEHARRLIEAQERRERARRFASFTSWVPDLQRVWAPKQQKTMSAKPEPLRKQSKRKERQRASYDVVCETPMTGKKHTCAQGSSIGDEQQHDYGSNSSVSVSKALFQDDW